MSLKQHSKLFLLVPVFQSCLCQPLYIWCWWYHCALKVKQYGSSPYCVSPSSVYCNIRLDFVKNHFMGTSCTQLHMFYVANKNGESETEFKYNHYAFVCHFIFNLLKTTQCLAHTYNSIAICCNISIFC